MESAHTEAYYPLTFREPDTKALGEHLRLRHCVELVGMKRVGISNFLRYFLNKKGIVENYIAEGELHLLIPVDLNALVEAELAPFWTLTFKRLVDSLEDFPADVPKGTVAKIAKLCDEAIKSQDRFVTFDNLRKSLGEVTAAGIIPTLFFLRFDRIREKVNGDFFANLAELREATAEKLAYVFTSYRALDEIVPLVFSHPMYIKPAQGQDIRTIYETFEARYKTSLGPKLVDKLIELSGGHVQYLLLSLIIINQKTDGKKVPGEEVLELVNNDERINLLSEEIWDSLTEEEKESLRSKSKAGGYLVQSGIVDENDKVFSPLFAKFVQGAGSAKSTNGKLDLTKKENTLFNFLLEHKDEVCEREKIIEAVWSEVEDLGVSDWTIDRLVARLRAKLKAQGGKSNIVTVKTRGYRLE